jgi:hypothetical protein
MEPALRHMISLPFSLRVVVAVGLLAPLGFTAGMAMPIGLRRFGSLYPAAVSWAWGVNGIASVLATALAVFVAITWGYTVTTLAAAACYLVAMANVAFGRWPAPGNSVIPEAQPLEALPALVEHAQPAVPV